MKFVSIIVRNIPLDHKRRLARLADEQDTSMSAIVANLAAERYGVAWRAEPRPSSTVDLAATQMEVKMPDTLRRKLNTERARTDVPVNTIMLGLIADHLDRTQAAA